MTTTSARLVAAVVAGAGTAAYYATPDLVRSRTARGWAKAGCLAVVTAAGVPDLVRGWRETQETARDAAQVRDAAAEPEADAPATLSDAMRALSPGWRVALSAGAVAVLAASTAASVGFERAVFRRGETRRAAGVPLAHTRSGLVLGALATVLALYPDPSDERR